MKTFEERKLEEFDKAVAENYRGRDPYWPDWEGVKSFTQTALKEQKEEILKGLPEIREVLGFSEYAEGQVVGFNQILEEIRKIIKEI